MKIQLSYTEVVFQNNRHLPKFVDHSRLDTIEDVLLHFFIYYDLILFTDDHPISISLLDAKSKQDSHIFDSDNLRYHRMLIDDIMKKGISFENVRLGLPSISDPLIQDNLDPSSEEKKEEPEPQVYTETYPQAYPEASEAEIENVFLDYMDRDNYNRRATDQD